MASTCLFYVLLILNSLSHIIGKNELTGAAEKYWNDKLANIPMPQSFHELLVTEKENGLSRGNRGYALAAEKENGLSRGNRGYALAAEKENGLSRGNRGYALAAEKENGLSRGNRGYALAAEKDNNLIRGNRNYALAAEKDNDLIRGNRNYALAAEKENDLSRGNRGYALAAEKENGLSRGNRGYALAAEKENGLSRGNRGYALAAEKDNNLIRGNRNYALAAEKDNDLIRGNRNYALAAEKENDLSRGNRGYALAAEKENGLSRGNRGYALAAEKENGLSRGNRGYALAAEKDNDLIRGNRNYALAVENDSGLSRGNRGYAVSAEKNALDSIKNMTTTYFLLNDFLRPKMKFCLPKSRPKNLAKFLPRNVAHSFSLSSKNLTSILKRLSIPPHSAEARQIQDVLKGCEGGLAVEHRKCVTSLEDMVDFALVYTGSKNVGVYENEITVEGETEEFAVGRTKMVGRKVVVCHKDMFPHAVYYCHNLEGTMGFEASLLGLRKGVKGGKVMVACHSETSTWNPRHLAFQVLKIKPGEGTICHVIDDNSIMWASP